jgi:hypothetical protein
MRASWKRPDDPTGTEGGPRRCQRFRRQLDNRKNTRTSNGNQADSLKLALATAIASDGGGLTHRDAAETLADLIGFLLGTDGAVATADIDAVANAIGKTIASVAHADREAGR